MKWGIGRWDELIMKHCLKLVFGTAAARLMECGKRARQLRSMEIIYCYIRTTLEVNQAVPSSAKKVNYCTSFFGEKPSLKSSQFQAAKLI